MADLYRVNENLLGEFILPPDKRLPNFENWIDCLLTPAQYLNNLNNMWREGTLPPIWSNTSPATHYDLGAIVLGRFDYRFQVYLSLIPNNIQPLSNTSAWLEIIDDFIGVGERVLYNGSKMLLEWALNKYFNTVYRQPVYYTLGVNNSDIYITDSDGNYSTFYISNSFYIAGMIGNNSTPGGGARGYITNTLVPINAAAVSNNFTINFPNSVYVTLPNYTGPGSCDTYITNFANNYVTMGCPYNIVTY